MEKKENASEEGKLSKDEILKNKFFERNQEKILSNIQNLNNFSKKDYIIISLLSILIILNIFHPFAGASQKEIKELSQRVSVLEERLLIPSEHEGIGMGDISSDQSKTEATQVQFIQSRQDKTKNKDKEYGGITQDKIKIYRVQSGDSLGTVTWKCYHTQEQSTVTALGLYNGLTPPYFDIYIDQELKIPLQKELYGWYEHHKTLKQTD